MPALPLYHLARKACIKNIKSITDVGDIPYNLIRPVLIKLENPDQLVNPPNPQTTPLPLQTSQLTRPPQRDLEKASPQLLGADAEIWLDFIRRDIPKWETKPHEPKNPKNWYKVYTKLRAETQAEVDKDAEILKAAMDGIKSERAKHTSKVIDPRSVPRLPRMGGMRVEGGRTRTTGGGSGGSSTLSFMSGSKTKVLTGKGVLEKARREAREMSLFSVRKTILATPTHKLNNKATQVRNAPQGLLEEHKRPAAPSYMNQSPKPPMVFAPRRNNVVSNPETPTTTDPTERERRLKAFTTPTTTTTTKRDNTGTPIPKSSTTLRPQNTSTFTPDSSFQPNLETSFPSAAYKAPRLKTSSSSDRRTPGHLESGKGPVDPLMRAKRRKIS
ncbi:MAG: hypothetical protein M1830_010627 [Pleopsidium flavum]|nr:MAG: hypothetical protein M1830_010627 [Pleopsidium flavum]